MSALNVVTVHNSMHFEDVEKHLKCGEQAVTDEDTEENDCIGSENTSSKRQEAVITQELGEEDTLENKDHLPDSMSDVIYYVSPLESIKELDEMDGKEEVSTIERCPGDGAAKIKEKAADREVTAPQEEEEEENYLASMDDSMQAYLGALLGDNGGVLPADHAYTNTDSAHSDHITPGGEEDHGTSVSALLEEGRWEQIVASDSKGGSKAVEEHCPLIEKVGEDNFCHITNSTDCRLDCDSLGELQALKLKHASHQTEINILCAELNDSKVRIRELQSELNSVKLKDEDHVHRIRELETEAANSTLIEVLTECKSKVEQLEEQKYSSQQLAIQLQEVNRIVGHLQKRIDYLEEDKNKKPVDIVNLTDQLAETRGVRDQSEEMENTKVLVRTLSEQLGNNPDHMSSHISAQSRRQAKQDGSDSKVCVLL
ncbi:coiled-coil domain-containing protein 150-like [Polyodon spathula]|uniref:coiled-coil domain-containing protein 150-like n=1 Tax=Polyodon spathula TaxID=7913 RepID=UPI001B7F1D3C|nr:coiled-coil domain-containing protein 150-like [Polyodon spathula]